MLMRIQPASMGEYFFPCPIGFYLDTSASSAYTNAAEVSIRAQHALEAKSMAKLPRTILLIDDSPADYATIQRALEHELVAAYTCTTVSTAATARACCRNAAPDAILLNDTLPDSDSLALLAELAGAH